MQSFFLYMPLSCSRVQAVMVAYHRARQWPEKGLSGGLMASTGLSAAAANERLQAEGLKSCVVACDNGPSSTTLAGERIPAPVSARPGTWLLSQTILKLGKQRQQVSHPEEACHSFLCLQHMRIDITWSTL